uniref:Nucleolar and spindle associated protein 1 n=1 Tax=Otolemur garnettii TaxID=30611 RepID=H0XMF0_OTOGA
TTVPSPEKLDSFKYSDLQNLAKSLGLRANLRADKLLKALKAHLKQEASKNQDESQTSASSCDETEIQINNQEHGDREPVAYVTKMRRRHKTVHGNPDFQQDHSEIHISDYTELQNHEKQENQHLSATIKVPSPSDESQGAENSFLNGNGDSKVPSERKKSLYTNEFCKPRKIKRTGITTPNFKKLHEAHFKEMESFNQYIERKKKHLEGHNSLNEPVNKSSTVTPVPPRGRLSVPCTPISQQSQGRFHTPTNESTSVLKGSAKRSALSTSKMNVRFSAADNEHKRSLTKAPARKSAHATTPGSTPKGETVLRTHNLKTSKVSMLASSCPIITPFKLTTQAMKTPVSNKKPIFDLKASLSRPLNYEPHKGKLKPWGQSKENNSLNEHGNVNFHKKTYKQPHLHTREAQQKKHEQQRKEKKAQVLGARRGLVMAKN